MKIFSPLWICRQPGLQSKFQDSQDYKESLSWKTSKQTIKETNKQTNKKAFLARRWWRMPVIWALWEAETGRFLNSRPTWSTVWVPEQPGLHRETLSQKLQKNPQKTKQNKQTQKTKWLHFHFPLHSYCIFMYKIVPEYFSK